MEENQLCELIGPMLPASLLCVSHTVELSPATPRMSDVLSVLASAAPPSSCRLMPVASIMESILLIVGLPLLLLPSVFPNIIVFSKEPSLDVPEIGQLQFCHMSLQ